MDWLQSLFTNLTSSAHIVFIYAIVIVFGFKLGKIKVGGI